MKNLKIKDINACERSEFIQALKPTKAKFWNLPYMQALFKITCRMWRNRVRKIKSF